MGIDIIVLLFICYNTGVFNYLFLLDEYVCEKFT